MALFRKRCTYCGNKIEKGREIFKNVKVAGMHGNFDKAFCSEKHVDIYEKKSNKKNKCGSCCG